MSYLTLEVEINHGKVVAKEPSKLPEKASGLLTLISSDHQNGGTLSPLEALRALEDHLGLSEEKATQWMAAVNQARR